jgi:hypothetical protein
MREAAGISGASGCGAAAMGLDKDQARFGPTPGKRGNENASYAPRSHASQAQESFKRCPGWAGGAWDDRHENLSIFAIASYSQLHYTYTVQLALFR